MSLTYIVTFLNDEGVSDWKEVTEDYIADDGETLHTLQPEEVLGVIGSESESFAVIPNEDPTKLPYTIDVEL